MIKFYALLLYLFFAANISKAQQQQASSGSVSIHLDDSKYTNLTISKAIIVLDKYDRTGAGIVQDMFDVVNKTITLNDVPEGKYYADICTVSVYRQQFHLIIKVKKKTTNYYKVKLDNVVYYPAAESEDLALK